MLDMVTMESMANQRAEYTGLTATMLGPNLDIKKYRQTMDEFAEDVETTRALREYAMFYARERELLKSRRDQELIKAFEQMQKDGTIEAFRKANEKWHKEHGHGS